MYFTNSSGYRIYYEDSGEENLIPIVFLHAWGTSHKDFSYSYDNLEGYRKIVYDHRGFGLSDRPDRDMSLGCLAQDLKELMDYLKLDKPILLGYSMGACILFKYFQMYGDGDIRSLIICDMTPKVVSDEDWNLGIMFGDFKQEDFIKSVADQFENMEEAYYHMYTKIDPDLKKIDQRVVKRAIAGDLAGNSYYSITSMWFSICSSDFREDIKKIKVPTGLFFASPGSLVNPEVVRYLEKNIENTYTCIFENSSHGFVNNKPRYFKMELENYLKIL